MSSCWRKPNIKKVNVKEISIPQTEKTPLKIFKKTKMQTKKKIPPQKKTKTHKQKPNWLSIL